MPYETCTVSPDPTRSDVAAEENHLGPRCHLRGGEQLDDRCRDGDRSYIGRILADVWRKSSAIVDTGQFSVASFDPKSMDLAHA
jgi:hypothetical protein